LEETNQELQTTIKENKQAIKDKDKEITNKNSQLNTLALNEKQLKESITKLNEKIKA